MTDKIDIATGLRYNSPSWKNKKVTWPELVQMLSQTVKTNETLKEFLGATREEQLRIKDVGGFVGGYLRGGKRKHDTVVHRQLLTLDIDFAHKDFWQDFTLAMDCAAVLHATHKHCEASPRYRLIIPLNRECTPDEYVAAGRKVAGDLGIDLFDNTTFEPNRLMFWPSTPKDMEYYFKTQAGPAVDVDEVLATYADWKDSSLWPTSQTKFDQVRAHADKQEDPETKKGIVGAFCRAYTMTEAITKFLTEEYLPTDIENRYTYSKSTTAAGLIVYDDKFAFSHHGTDPCSGKLSNAFDLVRVHRFGHLDEGLTSGKATKSYKAMDDFAREDKAVRKLIASDTLSDARYDFNEDMPEDLSEADPEAEDITWMQDLEIDGRKNYLSSATNLNLIFANDHRLKKLFRLNDFDSKRYVFNNLPWRKVPKPEPVRNVDYSGIRNYIESIYGITGAQKIEDSISLEFEKNHFHPVGDYLRGLTWDGVPRIDTLLINLFGAEDTQYTREAMRKWLVGGVARVMQPGIKFELVLVLVGAQIQGAGKSSFLKALGRQWFSDSFSTLQGKESFEQLQGAWIIEMAELAGLKNAEVEGIRHFISKQEDSFRPAYGRTTETYPRQSIFGGTTNRRDFLKDPVGNRRFMPIDTKPVKLVDNPELWAFINDEATINQVWAEAVTLYKAKEPLYLSHDAEAIAAVEQMKHSETDERKGIIEQYLNTPLPKDWDSKDEYDRRAYFADPLVKGTEAREYVCTAEIWCECLGKKREDLDPYKSRELNTIVRNIEGWEFINSTRNFSLYGKQKYYQKSNK